MSILFYFPTTINKYFKKKKNKEINPRPYSFILPILKIIKKIILKKKTQLMSTDSSPASPRWASPPLASSASVLIRAVSSDDVSGSSSGSELELEEEPKLDDAAPALVPVARLTNDETESDEAETEEEEGIDDVDGDGFAIRVRVPACGGGGEGRKNPSSESSGEESFDEVDGDGFSTGSRVHSRRNLNSSNSNAEKDEIFTVNSNLSENLGINGGYLDAVEEKDEILGSGSA